MKMKFKDLKPYISVLDRLSICSRETLMYQNYHCMEEVPDTYDELYVYGIGMIDSEFLIEGDLRPLEIKDREISKKRFLGKCIEIMVSEKPRNEFPLECTWNEYAYAGTRFPLMTEDEEGEEK